MSNGAGTLGVYVTLARTCIFFFMLHALLCISTVKPRCQTFIIAGDVRPVRIERTEPRAFIFVDTHWGVLIVDSLAPMVPVMCARFVGVYADHFKHKVASPLYNVVKESLSCTSLGYAAFAGSSDVTATASVGSAASVFTSSQNSSTASFSSGYPYLT